MMELDKHDESSTNLDIHTVHATAETGSSYTLSQDTSTVKWLNVITGFVVYFNTWGLLFSFGNLQAFYQESFLNNWSASDISWISTFCAFILCAGGVLTGRLYDAGYLRPLLLCGSFLEVVGLMMTSLSTQYYQIFLAQGLCVGLGATLLFVPSLAAVASGFNNKTRPKIIGIIASGAGVGGIVYPIVCRNLLSKVGFGWTIRIIAFLVFGTFATSYGTLLHPRERAKEMRRWFEWSALKEPPFFWTMIYAVFSGAGFYMPFLYLPRFTDLAIVKRNNTDLSFDVIAIVNGAAIIGRLAAGPVAARFGPLETNVAASACASIILFCWTHVSTAPGIIVWSAFWGLISSVIVALPGAVIPIITPSMSQIGTRLGMFWVCVGLGALVGSPIAGALAGRDPDEPVWWHIQVFAAFMNLTAAGALLYPAIILHGRVAQQ